MTTLQWSRIAAPDQQLHVARALFSMRDELPLHDHDFFECFFIESGQGWHRLPQERQRLEPGQLIFIRPGHAHAFRSQRQQPLTLINLAFEATGWRRFQRRHNDLLQALNLWQNQSVPTGVRLNPYQLTRLTELAMEVRTGEGTRLDADYFLCGLLRLLRPSTEFAKGTGTVPPWLREAFGAIRASGNLPGNVSELIKRCGRTPEHVARTFQQHLHLTPTQWLTQERMRLACRLLKEETLSITEIALECGMENLSHFHRCFKSHSGVTPLKYRQQSGLSIRGG